MGLRVIENHVTTNALNLSCPFRAFIARAFRQPGAAEAFAPGYGIRPLQGRERRVSATSPERAPISTARRSGNRSVPASDRHLPSPNGARSYSPGRSAAQAWDPGPPMAHTVDLSAAPTGRDNGRARQWASGIRQPGRNPRVGIVAPCQGFCRFARSTTRGCAPGFRIRPLQGRERCAGLWFLQPQGGAIL